MTALQTLTDQFLLENEVHLDLCNVTEEDVELWVKKPTDLDVSLPPQLQRGKLTSGSLGSVGGHYGGTMGCGRAVEAHQEAHQDPTGAAGGPGVVKGPQLEAHAIDSSADWERNASACH